MARLSLLGAQASFCSLTLIYEPSLEIPFISGHMAPPLESFSTKFVVSSTFNLRCIRIDCYTIFLFMPLKESSVMTPSLYGSTVSLVQFWLPRIVNRFFTAISEWKNRFLPTNPFLITGGIDSIESNQDSRFVFFFNQLPPQASLRAMLESRFISRARTRNVMMICSENALIYWGNGLCLPPTRRDCGEIVRDDSL